MQFIALKSVFLLALTAPLPLTTLQKKVLISLRPDVCVCCFSVTSQLSNSMTSLAGFR